MSKLIQKCPTCSQRVSVEGDITQYYKGVEARLTAQEIIDMFENPDGDFDHVEVVNLKWAAGLIRKKYLEGEG